MIAEVLCAAVLSLGISNADFACKHMDTVVEAAEASNIKPEILVALVHYESRWKPKAKSHASACGLTQVIPKFTGSRQTGNPKYTCKQLYNPTTSLWAGSRHLSYFVHKYGRGSYKIGLCGYLAGFRCKGKTPNGSGVRYSKKVRGLAKKISTEYSRIAHELEL
jgi:soluble lytic murein transglycosylase-like protein